MATEEELINIAKEMLNDDPKTVRLCSKGMKELPVECINFIAKDYKLERFGLEQNQLTTLPMEICKLTHLSYLNISSNAFKEFPEALCSMNNLEILDISRNKIRKMPDDFGTLISLKGLKISKNKIEQIPLYIAEMKDLQYLKLDGNQKLRFPPKSVCNMPKAGEGDEKVVMLSWLENLKEYLRKHSNNFSFNREVEMEESDHSSGEEDPALHNNKMLKKSVSSESMSYLMSTRMNAGGNLDSSNSSLKTISEDENLSNKKSHERKRPTPKLSIDLPSMRRDRSYSNDFDSTILNNVQKNLTRHSKSFSTDSISSSSTNGNNGNNLSQYQQYPLYHGGYYSHYHNNQNYYILEEKESENYFLKLKNMSPSEHLPMSDISLREASRNILYAFSQIHKALRQFANFTGNEKIFYNELNKATTTIGQLSNTLSRFDMVALQSAPESELCGKLLNSCQENILCFKQLIDLLNKRLKGIIAQSTDNMRYSRTLLIMLNGSIADIKFAWENIHPLLNDYTPYTGMSTPFRSRSMSRSNSTGGNNVMISASANSSSSNLGGNGGGLATPLYSAGLNSNGSISPYSLNTPSTGGLPSSPYSPYPSSNNSENSTNDLVSNGGSGMERTLSNSPLPDIRFSANVFDQLISKVDVSIKNVENVVKNLSENLDKIMNSTNSDSLGNNGIGGDDESSLPSLSKIRELKNLVKNTIDVTKKLKKSLLIPKLNANKKEELSVQLRVHGDSIVFLQTTVKMSSLAKEVSLEFPLPNKVMSGLGHVTKTNIDLTNFLRVIENNPTNISSPSQSSPFISNAPIFSSPNQSPPHTTNHSKNNSINEIDDDIKPFMIVTDDNGGKEIVIDDNNDSALEIEVTKAYNENEIRDSNINKFEQ
ncbi:RAM signaling pathway protein [Rhizophagus diaphanus]|nr:RAM signaling pathway protein [Rhizophagus diaphanus] [Rhizophagus sp. MUCL 43196]